MWNNEEIAHIAHEVNRAYCQAIGDDSQLPWEEAPEWQRSSCENGVRFHIENPTMTPEQSHENWLAQKKAEGWRYGAVKDADKKEHPCFCEYSQLPTEQKAKDYIFRAVVHSIHNLSNF